MGLFGKRRPPREPPRSGEREREVAPADVVRAYHQRTKHHPQRFAAGPYELDWENQPDPFRRYPGAPLLRLALPADADGGGPAYEAARLEGGVPPQPLDARSLSELLFDSLAISAWKQAGASRWSLRVNPSSGNLHPTEAYVIAPEVAGLSDAPAVLHYAPAEHGLEQLLDVPPDLFDALRGTLEPATLFVVLTSIDWREAWKYGERAYRYCNHDAGHALAALALAAGGRGWRARLIDTPASAELAELTGVARQTGPETEEAEALLAIGPELEGARRWSLAPQVVERFAALPIAAQPNQLSPEHVDWAVIGAVREATRKPSGSRDDAWRVPRRSAASTQPPGPPLRALVRRRRSAVAMDGKTSMPRADFFRALARTLPRAGEAPLALLSSPPRVHLALFVHRVPELTRGLYLLVRDPAREPALRAALRREFLWERAAGAPDDLSLYLLLPHDLRGAAAHIACNQALAGDGAFSVSMLADFDLALAEDGAAAYPRLYWETGILGQILYLEAEAQGLRGTGIGCFFDDAMHQLLGLSSTAAQSLYHFAVGGAVDDPRLSTHLAYP